MTRLDVVELLHHDLVELARVAHQFGQRLAELTGGRHVLGFVDRPQEGAGYVREIDRVRVHGRALRQWVGQGKRAYSRTPERAPNW